MIYATQNGSVQLYIAPANTAEPSMLVDTIPNAWTLFGSRGAASVEGAVTVNFTKEAQEVRNASFPQASHRYITGQAGSIAVAMNEMVMETLAVALGFLDIEDTPPTPTAPGIRELDLTAELGLDATRALCVRWAPSPYFNQPKATSGLHLGTQFYAPVVSAAGNISPALGRAGHPLVSTNFIPYRETEEQRWVKITERYAAPTS